jgi:hypothetical protein
MLHHREPYDFTAREVGGSWLPTHDHQAAGLEGTARKKGRQTLPQERLSALPWLRANRHAHEAAKAARMIRVELEEARNHPKCKADFVDLGDNDNKGIGGGAPCKNTVGVHNKIYSGMSCLSSDV